MTKICSRCKKELSVENFFKQPDGKYGVTSKCRTCSAFLQKEYINNNRDKHRTTRRKYENKRNLQGKQKAIEYKGGKCSVCGYAKCINALEFHHINPGEKGLSISSSGYKNWKKIQAELDKCILVCANCHREIHYAN